MSAIDQFMSAIRTVESSGNYQALGAQQGSKYGRARGAYQIMSEIWPGWAREAGIPGADWRDPAAQDHVARFKMSQYYDRYGDWRLVAAAWFGGPGAANRMMQGDDLSGTDDGFINVPTYVQRVVGNLDLTHEDQRMVATGRATQGEGYQAPPQPQPQQGEPREQLRKTYGEVLDAMSQVIQGSPQQFASMYAMPPNTEVQ